MKKFIANTVVVSCLSMCVIGGQDNSKQGVLERDVFGMMPEKGSYDIAPLKPEKPVAITPPKIIDSTSQKEISFFKRVLGGMQSACGWVKDVSCNSVNGSWQFSKNHPFIVGTTSVVVITAVAYLTCPFIREMINDKLGIQTDVEVDLELDQEELEKELKRLEEDKEEYIL